MGMLCCNLGAIQSDSHHPVRGHERSPRKSVSDAKWAFAAGVDVGGQSWDGGLDWTRQWRLFPSAHVANGVDDLDEV